jgi:hypothetical protein
MQAAIRVFFEFNESWLSRLLEQGAREGCLSVRVAPAEAARMLVGALEGEMLVARAYGDPARFAAAAELLLAQLQFDGPARRRPRGAPAPARRPSVHPGRRKMLRAPRSRRG